MKAGTGGGGAGERGWWGWGGRQRVEHGHVPCLLLTPGTEEESSLQPGGEAAVGTVCMGYPGLCPPGLVSTHLPHGAQLSSSLTPMKWARPLGSLDIPLPSEKQHSPERNPLGRKYYPPSNLHCVCDWSQLGAQGPLCKRWGRGVSHRHTEGWPQAPKQASFPLQQTSYFL